MSGHEVTICNATDSNKICNGSQRNLLFATVSVCLLIIVNGCTLGYPSPALENIKSHPNPFHLTVEEESWIGSVMIIGGLFGAVLCGLVIDNVGRKCTMIVAIVPYALSWLIIAAASNFWTMLTGRFINGFCAVWEHVAVMIYLSEIAPAALRGRLQTCYALANNGGVLLIYICGSQLSWTWLAVIPEIILCLAILMMQQIPETPRWLLANGYKCGAQASLVWLRNDDDVLPELIEISTRLSQSKPEQASWKEITSKAVFVPLLICMALWIFQVFSGVDYVFFYTVHIFRGTEDFFSPYYQTILVGFCGFMGNAAALFFVDKIGRKNSLIASGAAMTVCLALLGVFYKYQYTIDVFSKLTWLPLVCLMAYQISYSLGWGIAPSAITGEILPTRARGLGGGLALVTMCLSMFVETKFSLTLADRWIHQFGLFWAFAFIMLCSIVFVVLFVPETNKMSLEEIEAHFEDK